MSLLPNDLYSRAILNYAPMTTDIASPSVSGANASVFIARGPTEKQIFRYKSDAVSLRNHDISKILINYNIRMPRTKIYFFNERAIEVYPYIPGRTLYEYILDGLTQREIKRIYVDIAAGMKRMGQIPVSKFDKIPNKDCAQIARNNILTKTHSHILAQGVYYGTQILNHGPKTICHCDLNPRNIILDDKRKLAGILDLDAISVANINFAVALCGYNLKSIGQNQDLFYRTVDFTIPNQLNKYRIKVLEKIFQSYFSRYCKKEK